MVKTVFADSTILVVDKPPGLVTTSSKTHQEETLEDFLKSKFGIALERGGIVHRLDKDTSGLLVVAKTKEVLDNLQAQFKARTVEKEYLALVHGWVKEKGRVEAAVARNPRVHDKFMVEEAGFGARPACQRQSVAMAGREAVTEYEPINNFQFSTFNFQKIFSHLNKSELKKLEGMKYNQFTLLRAHPLTGRTHQIRVHLKYRGFPVVSDSKYGGRKMARWDRQWCPRQFLHAAKLEFNHPLSGKRMRFMSALPDDLKSTLSVLSEYLE